MSQKHRSIIYIIMFMPLYILLYTFLHEGGHALVILAYGGVIDNFVLGLNAHVVSHGANFTTFGEALNNIAGMLLPAIIGGIAICFYKPKVNFAAYHICYLNGSISLVSSMLAWIVIPIISLFAIPPQGDDVTKFLNTVGIHPLFVSLGVLLLVIGFVFLVYKKGIFLQAKKVMLSMRKSEGISRKRIILAASIVLLSMAAVFAVAYKIATPSIVFSTSIVTDNTFENTYRECTFEIEKSKTYSVNLNILSHGIITAVRILDESGELIYQDLAEEFAGNFSIGLQKGVYTLSLTYLVDYEAVEGFFSDTGQSDMLPSWRSYYDEVLDRDTDGSASFSIKIN